MRRNSLEGPSFGGEGRAYPANRQHAGFDSAPGSSRRDLRMLLVPPGFALTRKTNSADFLTDPCGVIYARIRPRRPAFARHGAHKERERGFPRPQEPRCRESAISTPRTQEDGERGRRGRGCKSRRKMSRRCDTRYYPPPKHPGSRNDLTSPTFAVAPFRGDKKRRDGLTVDKIISDIIALARENAPSARECGGRCRAANERKKITVVCGLAGGILSRDFLSESFNWNL